MNGFYVAVSSLSFAVLAAILIETYNNYTYSVGNNNYQFKCNITDNCPYCVYQGKLYISECVQKLCKLCSKIITPT